MIYFSDRKKLDKIYKKWAEENYVPKSTFNCITFLSDLLDENKVKKFLEENK